MFINSKVRLPPTTPYGKLHIVEEWRAIRVLHVPSEDADPINGSPDRGTYAARKKHGDELAGTAAQHCWVAARQDPVWKTEVSEEQGEDEDNGLAVALIRASNPRLAAVGRRVNVGRTADAKTVLAKAAAV